MTTLPFELVEKRPAPTGTKQCSVCRLAYNLHTGEVCRICRRPVEHHQDATVLRVEIEGCARLSEARLASGLKIRPFEQWCIDRLDRLAVSA